MPNRLAVINTLAQDVLGVHRWDERTRTYPTVPIEEVWAVESAATAILERVARVIDWPRLLREAALRHEALHPERDAYQEWTPKLGVCRECMTQALLSDQHGATNWLEHPATPVEHDQVDWPTVVATRLPFRQAAVRHPYESAPPVDAPTVDVAPPRVDVVIDRDPDNGTDATVYIGGALLRSAQVHVLDPGRSGADHEWWESVTAHDADVPQAVRDKIEEIAEQYHDPGMCSDRCT